MGRFLGVVVAVLAATLWPTVADAATRKPNIIVILADDLGYNDIGCYGSTVNPTPHLDALAAGGMRFTDFHASAPMCTPTRVALLTGRYQHRYGMERVLGSSGMTYEMGLPLEAMTLAEHLTAVGYATGITGKWHLGYIPEYNPVRQGFDFFRGHVSGAGDYISHIDRSGREDWWWNDTPHMEQGYNTHLTNGHSLDFIRQHKDRPFFLYVSHSAVHFPWQGPNDKADRVKGETYWSDAKWGSRTDRKAALREMITEMDEGVGQIVALLRDLDLENDTLILFMSDNGGHKMVSSNAPSRGVKGDVFEGGHRVPAIAYWPGKIPVGSTTDATVTTMDLAPSVFELLGYMPPKESEPFDGVSYLPVMLGTGAMPERTLFWRIKHKRAVRRGPWKVVIQDDTPRLYNLDRDVGERTDLSQVYPIRIQKMLHSLTAWERDVDASAREQGLTNNWDALEARWSPSAS
jgi:arylsulfatase A-like enzyme